MRTRQKERRTKETRGKERSKEKCFEQAKIKKAGYVKKETPYKQTNKKYKERIKKKSFEQTTKQK